MAPIRDLAPGLGLATAIAVVATLLHNTLLTVLSPLILAVAIGIAVRNFAGPIRICEAGQSFVLRRLLRLAIILLGFQVSVGQILSLGAGGIVIVLIATPATFVFIRLLGRWAGLDPALSTLLASGASICGASAIVATNSVVKAPEEDVAYAIACITLYGTIAMFLYPIVGPLVGLQGVAYGLWAGGSIHEVGQAVAASFQGGQEAGHAGLVAKLLRVALLAPLVMALAIRGRRSTEPAAIPWYLLGFVAVIVLNSLVAIPAEATRAINTVTTFMMTMALASMGLVTNLRALLRRGGTPMAVAGAGGLFMCGLVLLLATWIA